MKKIIYIFIFLLLSGCALLDNKEPIHAEIYQYGLYENIGEYFTEDAKSIPSGKTGRSTEGVKFVRQTDKIPLFLGVHFGYDFRIYGLKGKSVILKCVVTHPPIRRYDGEIQTSFEYKKSFEIIDGVVDDGADYYVNHEYELVPGKWTRSYFYNGKRILYKEFDVSSKYNMF